MNIKAVFGSHILKMRNTLFICSLINIQNVSSAQRILIDGVAYIHIHQPVVIDINYSDSPGPSAHPTNTGLFCYILKFEIAFVEIKPAGYRIAGKIDIRQPVIIKITNTNPTTIININNIQRVNRIIFDYDIIEIYTGMRSGYFFK